MSGAVGMDKPHPMNEDKKTESANRRFFKIGRDKADPEKAVLPTILFVNTNHESFTDVRRRGFMLCLGWWDYSIKFGLFF